MNSDLTFVLLNELRVSPFNLRTPDTETPEFQQLLASIEANGVLEPLIVEPTRGVVDQSVPSCVGFDVLQGGHRLMALQRLDGMRPEDNFRRVPCQVLHGLTEVEAREVALATTVIRRPLHPVDEYEAFARLAAEGLDAAAIARRFGISERGVKQRLALGGLCPEARERWRAGELDFEAAAALTQAGDFDRQRHALATVRKERQNWWTAKNVVQAIRRVMAEGRVRADQSGEWRYAEAEYRAAGGAVSEDLFSDEIMIEDVPLLKQVAKAKALAEGEAFQKEHGFGACFFFEDNVAAHAFELTEVDFDEFEPLPEDQEKLDRIDAAYAALPEWSDVNAIEDDAAREAAADKLRADQKRLNAERSQAELKVELQIFKQEVDCTRHAVGVRIRADGELDVSFGYVIPGMGEAPQQDEPDRKSLPTTQDAAKPSTVPEPKGLADSHRAELAVLMGKACAEAIEARSGLALPVLVASLCSGRDTVPLEFSGLYRLKDGNTGFGAELRRIDALGSLEQDQELARRVVAKLVSLGSYALEKGGYAAFFALIEERDEIFQARLRRLFDASEFFARAPREIMDQAVSELVMEGYRAAAPKKEMLGLVADAAKRRGWLPKTLRTAGYALLPAEAAPQKAKPAKGKPPKASKPAPAKKAKAPKKEAA